MKRNSEAKKLPHSPCNKIIILYLRVNHISKLSEHFVAACLHLRKASLQGFHLRDCVTSFKKLKGD